MHVVLKLLVFCLLVSSALAVSRIIKEAKKRRALKYDIAEGITGSSLKGKVLGHEKMLRDAYTRWHADDANSPYLTYVADPKAGSALVYGVQYPDMPILGPNRAMLGDDLQGPSQIGVVAFGSEFLQGENLGTRDTIVQNTHFGCLQHWHSMCPEPLISATQYRTWTNADLYQLILNSLHRIWDVAVGKLMNGQQDLAEFHLGRIIHTLGDSFPAGHTLRGGSGDYCGKIYVYQEYNAQKGNDGHAKADKPDSDSRLFECGVQAIKALFDIWGKCAKSKASDDCQFPESLFESIEKPADAVASLRAGGALNGFKGSDATDLKELIVPDRLGQDQSVPVYFPPMGSRTEVKGGITPDAACDNWLAAAGGGGGPDGAKGTVSADGKSAGSMGTAAADAAPAASGAEDDTPSSNQD